ncbi:MAG: DUF6868 family protein [Mariprofundaceae bacterium]
MTVDLLLGLLGWSTVINFGLLLWWSLWIIFAHDFVYRMQSRWFRIPVEKFDAINYAGMAFYKITIVVFNIVPYLALRIIM